MLTVEEMREVMRKHNLLLLLLIFFLLPFCFVIPIDRLFEYIAVEIERLKDVMSEL